MITKMEVYSSVESAPELPLAGATASDDPIQIRDVGGLGPVKSDISTTPYASGRGEQYQGSTTGKRNIILTLGLNPNWIDQTMATLRQQLYAYLLPEMWCKLRFYTDYLPPVDIEGYVESFEPNIFSQDPELQISIICPKPDFVQADVTQVSGSTVILGATSEDVFEYVGTVKTGFELGVYSSVDLPDYTGKLRIVNKAPLAAQTFEVDPMIVDGSKSFRFSSVRNIKRVQTLSGGDIINLLQGVTAESVWPELKPGTNKFQVKTTTAGLTWTLAYFNKFGGL